MSSSLTDEEVRALQEAQLILPSAIAGKRKFSSSLLNPPPSEGYRSSSSGPIVATFRVHSTKSSMRPTFDFPESTVSPVALEYIGFTQSTAQTIFENFKTSTQARDCDPAEHNGILLTFVTSHILRVESVDQDDPQEALRAIGINERTASAILNPAHTAMFNTQSLHHWVHDTVVTNFKSMLAKEEKIKISARNFLGRQGKDERKPSETM